MDCDLIVSSKMHSIDCGENCYLYFWSKRITIYQAKSKTRKWDRQFLNRLASLGGLFVLLAVLSTLPVSFSLFIHWMKNAQFLHPFRLVVTGKCYYTSDKDILSILKINAYTLLIQDVKTIQQQIKCLSWVKQVKVRKIWPSTLEIDLAEYIPLACWNNRYMIDEQGNTFQIPNHWREYKVWPMITGPEGMEKKIIETYQKARRVLENNFLATLKGRF